MQDLETRLAPAGLSPVASFLNATGDNPYGPLIEDASGNFFGTTANGGASGGYGTVFEVKAGGGAVTTLASFNNANGANPEGGLIEDSSGNLFGTTVQGGAFNLGTVFEVKAGSGVVTTIASFNNVDGARPYAGLIEDASGNLFGTTFYGGINAFVPGYGTIFEVKAGTNSITTLAAFDNTHGANPNGGLVEDASGNLFGATVNGGAFGDGTVFELHAGSGFVTTLASFNGSNGANPYGNLVEDAGGNLYGTVHGSYGSVFEVQAGSGAITTLASFNGSNGSSPLGNLVRDSSGNLFGATAGGGTGYGTVFEVLSGSGAITTLASFNGGNGYNPQGGVIKDASGNLFGTATNGGTGGGTVFEVKAGTGAVTTLAAFGDPNGSAPSSSLARDAAGDLFGATSGGGTGYGTIFEVQAGSGAITTLVAFNNSNGANPQGNLVADASGDLFGVTSSGGAFGYGTIFELKAGSGAITTLASFNGANGSYPQGGLIADASGDLFGAASSGGAFGYGTVFELKAGSGAITTLASFNGANGSSPQGGLVEDASGNLFGAASSGGASGYGTVFEVKAGSGAVAMLAAFNNNNGANPQGNLVADASGDLFGVASSGGYSGFGTVFEVQAGSGTITTLASFAGSGGYNPYGGLIEDAAGNLFGTTVHGGNAGGYGTVFEVQAGSGIVTILASFDNANGANPQAGLFQDAKGNLWGAASAGGTSGIGTIFELSAPPLLLGPAVLPGGTVGVLYSQAIAASGDFSASFAYQVTAGSLPPGLVLNAASGSLSGTPYSPAGAPFSFTVTASDSRGNTCSRTYGVAIASPLGASSDAVYVENLYGELLHRGADSGAALWVGLLGRGVARSTVILDIEQTTEYLSGTLSSLYQHYLHRAADPGAQGWVNLLAHGVSIEQVTTAIVSSSEYFALHGGSRAGMIQGLYLDILGRTASAADVQSWVNVLSGGATPAQVALGFLNSLEYRTNLVDSYFAEFLRRNADPGGANGWAQSLASGMNDQAVLAAIFGSPEGYADW